jgi:phytanoyl-CoA hydroxylase
LTGDPKRAITDRPVRYEAAMVSDEERARWERDGYFIRRRATDAEVGHAMATELIDLIRADPPSSHPGESAYVLDGGLLVQPEGKVPEGAREPEDFVAKLFNAHLVGTTREFAQSELVADIVADLLGPDIDVFQSQFILKNPGAWGQPWHQDSYYFRFDQQPQIGLWLAITEATLENGCLSVLPGSHHLPIQTHDPDDRSGANQGYTVVRTADDAKAVPVLMEPGDLLVFHSYLLHRSVDNRSNGRRAAMVYHYGRAGTKNQAPPEIVAMQERVTRWVPVRRAA